MGFFKTILQWSVMREENCWWTRLNKSRREVGEGQVGWNKRGRKEEKGERTDKGSQELPNIPAMWHCCQYKRPHGNAEGSTSGTADLQPARGVMRLLLPCCPYRERQAAFQPDLLAVLAILGWEAPTLLVVGLKKVSWGLSELRRKITWCQLIVGQKKTRKSWWGQRETKNCWNNTPKRKRSGQKNT